MNKVPILLIAAALTVGCSTTPETKSEPGPKSEPACRVMAHEGPTNNTNPLNMYNVPQIPVDGSRAAIPCTVEGLVNSPGPMQSFIEQRTVKADHMSASQDGWNYASILAEKKSGIASQVIVTYVGYEKEKVLVEYVVEDLGKKLSGSSEHADQLGAFTIVRFLNPTKAEVVFRQK